MGDSVSDQVPLPLSVERMIGKICFDQSQPPPDGKARMVLASIGENSATDMLKTISQQKIKTFSGFIKHMVKYYPPVTTNNASESAESFSLSAHNQTSTSVPSVDDYIYHSPFPRHLIHSPASSLERTSTPIGAQFSPSSSLQRTNNSIATQALSSKSSTSEMSSTPVAKRLEFSPVSSSERAITPKISKQWLILIELEFRKVFLLLSYIGRKKLEDVISVDDALKILEMKDYPMLVFESQVWNAYGRHCLVGKDSIDRRKYLDWDSGKTHNYFCFVSQDGSCSFTGPCLNTTKTLLHRTLGDENVLIVRFEEQSMVSSNFSANYNAAYMKIAEEGIFIGHKRFRFFVFKDGDRKGKKKSPASSFVKCYFVRTELIAPCDEKEPYIFFNKTMHEARCLFMHLHTTPSMAKYASRCSLALSKTIKLSVDLATVHIERIEDIPCCDESGCGICNEDGDLLIHTDGTGFISEDLAMKCPRGFQDAKYMKDEILELVDKSLEGQGTDAYVREPPLLMQCRLFHNGCAVKGTLLVNRKLPHGTIQIRPSMVKVEADSRLLNAPSLSSLEVVKISNKPRRTTLSKYLIALLSFGGVPTQFFLDLLTIALEDAQKIYSNKHAAVRVSLNYGDIDDDFTTTKMIGAGIPLNEPCVQYRLSRLASEERKGLQAGKLPISESFYLMGTADPTGLLNPDEICVILESGQISGKVLVYRNPGLHFGDIHVLNAVYLKDLEDVVGNAKYGIFFSTKGRRSVASEIANGDFDGDMYWVSRNPQLLHFYKASMPWVRMHSSPKVFQRKPSEIPSDALEHELFELFLNTNKQNVSMGVAADSWLVFMDRLLMLGDDSADEKSRLKERMLSLVDIYYDALDAPKTGKKVVVPNRLKPEKYPHHMERSYEYHSTSILGLIYDIMILSQTENYPIGEIWKLPCFEQVQIPDASLNLWKTRYDNYRREMAEALSCNDESNISADDVINKYKQMLYNAADFERTTRNEEDIFVDALALYHVCYDFAKSKGDVGKCNFAWRVAGPALCKFHAKKVVERSSILFLPSVLGEVLN